MNSIRTPKQKRGIDTKERITKAAMKLFAEKGIHGTTSKEIAKKAGVSIGSFYSYFKNKKKLLLEMLEDYVEDHYEAIWLTLGSLRVEKLDRDDLRTLIIGTFKAYELAPEFHRQTHSLRYTDPDIKRIYDREREREVRQIQFLIEKNAGHIVPIKDPRAVAMVVHNAVENVAHTAKFYGTDISEAKLADALADMIAGFIIDNSKPGDAIDF